MIFEKNFYEVRYKYLDFNEMIILKFYKLYDANYFYRLRTELKNHYFCGILTSKLYRIIIFN